MTRHRLLPILLASALFLPGCALLKGLFESTFKKPDLRFKTANLQDVNLGGARLDTVWLLDNPNPMGLSVAHIDYTFFVEDKQVVAGQPRRGLQIPASKQAELTFPAELKFADLASTLGTFLNQDTAKYRAEGTIGLDTPIGIIKLPLKKEGLFEVPKIPAFTLERPRITSMNLTSATLEIPLKLTNKNSYPLPLTGLVGNLSIGGANVGNVTAGQLGLLPPKGTQTVTLPVTVDFTRALQAANAIRQGRGKVELTGNLTSGSAQVPVSLGQVLDFIKR
jgi:LEA14-like dessication related protein